MSRSIGETLSARRRELGKSLADAEAATKIRARRLDALEKGEWAALPSSAYVKGYIISYAQYLELDPEPLIAALRNEIGSEGGAESDIEGAPRRRVVAPRDTVVTARGQLHTIPWRAAAALIALIVVVALAIWFVGNGSREQGEQRPLPNVSETSSSASIDETLPGTTPTNTTPVPQSDEVVVPDETTAQTAGAFTLTIQIDPAAASWLRVTVDGLKAYEGTLAAGETKEWEVSQEAIVRVGKVTAVTVKKNDESVEVPVGSDGIGQVTLTAD